MNILLILLPCALGFGLDDMFGADFGREHPSHPSTHTNRSSAVHQRLTPLSGTSNHHSPSSGAQNVIKTRSTPRTTLRSTAAPRNANHSPKNTTHAPEHLTAADEAAVSRIVRLLKKLNVSDERKLESLLKKVVSAQEKQGSVSHSVGEKIGSLLNHSPPVKAATTKVKTTSSSPSTSSHLHATGTTSGKKVGHGGRYFFVFCVLIILVILVVFLIKRRENGSTIKSSTQNAAQYFGFKVPQAPAFPMIGNPETKVGSKAQGVQPQTNNNNNNSSAAPTKTRWY